MSNTIDLREVVLETNSPLWQISELATESVLQVIGNKEVDHVGGKVALIGDVKHNYTMQTEMRFLRHYLSQERAGWFGFVIRAQDVLNYEIIWFMPKAESGNTVAYVPVAHGVVPWWIEAYSNQKKGTPYVPDDCWFRARVDVLGDELSVYVEDQFVFTKKMTYYLSEGRPGLYVGTATDAIFRRIIIENLP